MKGRFFNQLFQTVENSLSPTEVSVFGQHWRMTFADGIAFIILGIVILFLPVFSVARLALGLSSVLIVSGIIYLTQSFEFQHQRGSVIRLLQSFLAIILGGLLIQYASYGVNPVSLALALYFIFGAILNWVFYSEVRPHGGWNWGLLSSIVSYFLGLAIVAVFPFVALWIPASLLAVELLISGSGMIGFAISVHRLQIKKQNDFYESTHTDQGLFDQTHSKYRPIIDR